MSTQPVEPSPRIRLGAAGTLALFVLVGAAVSVALGVYGREHVATGQTLTTLGFRSLPAMKAWLTTGALLFGLVQVGTALRIYGRVGHGEAPAAVKTTHRLSGLVAVLLTLPVAFQCLWSLGFSTYTTRVLVHSLLGCAFYGVFVTKMLALRSRHVPGWALPVAGGLLFTVLVGLWLSSALWYFTTGASLGY